MSCCTKDFTLLSHQYSLRTLLSSSFPSDVGRQQSSDLRNFTLLCGDTYLINVAVLVLQCASLNIPHGVYYFALLLFWCLVLFTYSVLSNCIAGFEIHLNMMFSPVLFARRSWSGFPVRTLELFWQKCNAFQAYMGDFFFPPQMFALFCSWPKMTFSARWYFAQIIPSLLFRRLWESHSKHSSQRLGFQ